jgi:hypothetical protein
MTGMKYTSAFEEPHTTEYVTNMLCLAVMLA